MKTPDKIYLEKSLSYPDRLHSQWYPNDVIGGGIEYIRKDLSDKTIELAEDHAYFAGHENFRENVLEWAKVQKEKIGIGLAEYDMVKENGKLEVLNALIEKIKTL